MPVELERHDGVALLTLSRPEALNALSIQLLTDLDEALEAVAADPGVGAMVLIGAGEKAFSAGADLREVHENGPMEGRAFAGRGHAVLNKLEAMAVPSIAAVNGYALGGGCELALACDLRLAADSAQMALPEVNLGIFPGWGGTIRLARLTSLGFAKEMILTGRRVGAEEAHRVGMVNHVHPAAELRERALELGAEIAAKPAFSLGSAKELINRAFDSDPAKGLAHELDRFALCFATEDQKEGMAAFVEKRPARFRGR